MVPLHYGSWLPLHATTLSNLHIGAYFVLHHSSCWILIVTVYSQGRVLSPKITHPHSVHNRSYTPLKTWKNWWIVINSEFCFQDEAPARLYFVQFNFSLVLFLFFLYTVSKNWKKSLVILNDFVCDFCCVLIFRA